MVPLARTAGGPGWWGLSTRTLSREWPCQTAAETLHRPEARYGLLTEKYGIPPEDIIWDPLVFPCGTGDAGRGSARWRPSRPAPHQAGVPDARLILGVSNVTSAFPTPGGKCSTR